MKKGLFLISLILLANNAVAQTTVKKVPFLPYTGATATYTDASGNIVRARNSSAQPFAGQPISKPYETIFFENGSANIRKDQIPRLKKIAKRLRAEGGNFVTFVGFSTPEISTQQARDRIATAISAMQDLGMQNTPVTDVEYKKRPVLNPNRVEIYMHSTGLGSASTSGGSGL